MQTNAYTEHKIPISKENLNLYLLSQIIVFKPLPVEYWQFRKEFYSSCLGKPPTRIIAVLKTGIPRKMIFSRKTFVPFLLNMHEVG